jgi:hypothetical protein
MKTTLSAYTNWRKRERERSAYTGNRLNLKKEREIGNVLSNDVTLVSL